MANNLTLGRGKLYFARFGAGTQTPGGERYFGNTPSFSVTFKEDKLEHYGSDFGVKEKDDSITLQVDRTAKLTCDNIDKPNLALFFFGSAETVTTTSATDVAQTLADVEKGLFYQLGVSASAPAGVRKIANLVVKKGVTTLVLGTDYAADLDLARIEVLSTGSTITNGDDLSITYDVTANTRSRVISGGTPVEGTLRFVSFNPKGEQTDFFFPWVKLSPDGDLALKGDDWQNIPFSIEILKKTGLEAIYADGRPVAS